MYVPPHEPEYHFHLAPSVPKLPPVMFSVDDNPEHITEGLEVTAVTGIEGLWIVTVTEMQAVVVQDPSALT